MILQNFLITGDTHARHGPYDDDLSISEQLLWDLGKLAKSNLCSTLILNGDVWHLKNWKEKHNKGFTEVLLMLYRVLLGLRLQGLNVVWIRGNHEITDRLRPHHTLMSLFSRVCNVVIRPQKIETKSTVIWCIPWYPGPVYKRILKEVCKQALTETRRKIIVSHIGVKEGVVSASNYRIDQEVGTKDFCPHLFDYIILGDYHSHQYLDTNVLYLGAPIPLNFGDTGNVGPWCLRLSGSCTLQPLVLPSIYPQYDKYVLKDKQNLVLSSYNRNNRNSIKCHVSVAAQVQSMYPEASIEYFEDEEVSADQGRLQDIPDNDWKAIFDEFCTSRQWDDHYKELGVQYLQEAINQ